MKKPVKKKGVIYTCIVGGYDELFNPPYKDPEWDYICFSNEVKTAPHNDAWNIVPLRHESRDGTRTNRWHKINAHFCVGEYEQSIYIDANIDVIDKEFFDTINRKSAKSSFALMRHPERDCVYEEARACIESKKDDTVTIEAHMQIYRDEGYPPQNGLYTTSFLYRKHNEKHIVELMNSWWDWLEGHAKRDQLSLPYVLWQHRFVPDILPFTYGLGKQGPLFYYPHVSGTREYIRGLYDIIEYLKGVEAGFLHNQELTERQLKVTRDRLAQIENSTTWRLRRKIMKLLRRK